MKIKLLIVDDEPLIRGGLTTILETYDDIEVLGNASNGMEAIDALKHQNVDVILMDIRMPKMDGVEATKIIKQQYPNIKVLILTTFKDDEYIKEAIAYGASGYLLKDSEYDQIYNSIKTIHQGKIVIDPDAIQSILKQKNKSITKIIEEFNLSEQEVKIIKEVASGKSNKKISESIYLCEGTIKNHITNILDKLELESRTQLTAFAYKNNFMDENNL